MGGLPLGGDGGVAGGGGGDAGDGYGIRDADDGDIADGNADRNAAAGDVAGDAGDGYGICDTGDTADGYGIRDLADGDAAAGNVGAGNGNAGAGNAGAGNTADGYGISDTDGNAGAGNTTPRHIAIVMDGNGRWARRHGLPRIDGHRRGVEVVKNLVPPLCRRGIPYLTLFAFSSENWRRPSAEVALLLELLATSFEAETKHLHAHGIRLRVIGDMSRFPARLRRKIAESTALTRDNRTLNLTVALGYGGRWDMAQACREIAAQVARAELTADAITPALIQSRLCTRDLPEPDLFIRTGGEQRISNFLLWQLAYTELYFSDVYWPDFDETHLQSALTEYARRQRRFGKTAEQIHVAGK